MKRPLRLTLGVAGLLAVVWLAYVGFILWDIALIGSAYKAKLLCSGVFVSKRDALSVLSEDLLADDMAILKHFDSSIDFQKRSVTAGIRGLATRTAVYREGLGCTVAIGTSEETLRAQADPPSIFVPQASSEATWPGGNIPAIDSSFPEADRRLIAETLHWAFSEPDPSRLRRTRAVVVVHRGEIIAEQYAEGFSASTPLIGWSMTKSVLNVLIGILVAQGKLSLEDHDLILQWRASGDPRRDISLNQMLRMTSGLAFNESYTNLRSDVIQMLLGAGDMAGYAAAKPLRNPPGRAWHYSSGTSNILALLIRERLTGSFADHVLFPRHALFDRIGMSSAVMEPDAAGTLVASSYLYATAGDWARFGLFCLQDGIWEGERLLPEGWMKYSRAPTAEAPSGKFGAHFWLQIPEVYGGLPPATSKLPADGFHAIGHEGQFLSMFPSCDLVVVRFGLTRFPHTWNHEEFLTRIVDRVSKLHPEEKKRAEMSIKANSGRQPEKGPEPGCTRHP
jgi:CubicO group peptidase (beta-lactamase class C family)